MKKKLAVFLCAFFCALLILFNPAAMAAAREGFLLWRDSVMPALLPFFVCTSLLRQFGALESGNALALFALAFISGAPGGARLCAQYTTDGKADDGLSALAAALNTVSPMFIAGAFATGMLDSPRAAVPILLAQLIAAAFTVLFVKKAYGFHLVSTAPEQSLPLACRFAASITEAVSSILSVLGAIVFFFVAIRLLEETGLTRLLLFPFRILAPGRGNGAAEAVFSGFFEMTAGAKAVSGLPLSLRVKSALGAFLFSFGGLCIAAQSLLFFPVTLKKYLPLKLAQGLVSALLCYLIFPLCFFGAAQTGSVTAETLAENALTAGAIFAVSLLGTAVVLLYSAILGKRSRMRK
ncbi:MAG: hypothetical protein E7330_06255 [Clostridiales bacterium]|nr:hypothetical protein [Clostridiales bacterium]